MSFIEKLSGMLSTENEDEIREIIHTMNSREKNSFIIGYFDFLSEDKREEFIFDRVMDMKNNKVNPKGWVNMI